MDYDEENQPVPYGHQGDETEVLKWVTRVDLKKDNIKPSVAAKFGASLSPHAAMANYGAKESEALAWSDSLIAELAIDSSEDGLFTLETHANILGAYGLVNSQRTLGKGGRDNLLRMVKTQISEHTTMSKHQEDIKSGRLLMRRQG